MGKHIVFNCLHSLNMKLESSIFLHMLLIYLWQLFPLWPTFCCESAVDSCVSCRHQQKCKIMSCTLNQNIHDQNWIQWVHHVLKELARLTESTNLHNQITPTLSPSLLIPELKDLFKAIAFKKKKTYSTAFTLLRRESITIVNRE